MDQKTLPPPTTIIQEAPRKPEGKQNSYLSLFLGIVVVLLMGSTIFQVLLYSRQNELKGQSGSTAVSVSPKGSIVNDFTFNIGRRGGRRKFRERVEVNNREEDISTDDARMIFDYANGILVTQFVDGKVCYVTKFNPKMSIDEVRGNLSNTKLDQAEVDDTDDTEEMYKSTNETVNPMFLSKKAREMCANSKILVAEEEDDVETRDKRSIPSICRLFKYRCCYSYVWPWCLHCDKYGCIFRPCWRRGCLFTIFSSGPRNCVSCISHFG